MSNGKRIPESARAILTKVENEEMFFSSIKDANQYVAPISCLIEKDLHLNCEYLLSYFVHNKEIKEDGTIYLAKAEIISRQGLMSQTLV